MLTLKTPEKTTLAQYAPTVYEHLYRAYDFFNARFFDGELKGAVLTLQKLRKARGHFGPCRFAPRDDDTTNLPDIALNYETFASRTDREIISTLLHEMVHQWQHEKGEHYPKTKAHHNREWADKMKLVGLMPSTTGAPGGDETGRSCSHYIPEDHNPDAEPIYSSAYDALVKTGYRETPTELWSTQYLAAAAPAGGEEETERAKKQRASKTKFTCPECGANAWAKPSANLWCGECQIKMETEE